jgi:hypothetical protein
MRKSVQDAAAGKLIALLIDMNLPDAGSIFCDNTAMGVDLSQILAAALPHNS